MESVNKKFGQCQVCGRDGLAIGRDGNISRHGYTKLGLYSCTRTRSCSGSHNAPAPAYDKVDQLIKWATRDLDDARRTLEALNAGRYETYFSYEDGTGSYEKIENVPEGETLNENHFAKQRCITRSKINRLESELNKLYERRATLRVRSGDFEAELNAERDRLGEVE